MNLDQFYTEETIAKFCYKELEKEYNLNNFLLFEPSAGTGSFSNLFHKKSLAIDIDPKNNNIKKMDFFEFDKELLKNKKVFTIGNPPFGKLSSKAVKFFNKSSEFSENIAFIVPKTFKKESVKNKLNNFFHLKKEIEIPLKSFIYKEKEYSVPCVFQIWEKKNYKRNILKYNVENEFISFVKKEEADIAIRRVGNLSGKIIYDLNKYSKSSHYYLNIKKDKERVIKILNSLFIQFNEISKNTAGNPSLSKVELINIFKENIK